MSTTVDSGQSPDISKLISDYQNNPSKNSKSGSKALKAIEAQIDQLSNETLKLQSELEESYDQLQRGDSGLNPGRIGNIRGDIESKQKELSHLKIQLARLAKYKKSQKLADRILSLNISLGELDGRANSISKNVKNGIPRSNHLRLEINSILKETNKKTKKAQSGHLLYEAVQKYKELEVIRNTLKDGSDAQRNLDAQMKAIRVRMTKIATKQLPLSKREGKFFTQYTQRDLKGQKLNKQVALEMRVAVGKNFFTRTVTQNFQPNYDKLSGKDFNSGSLVEKPGTEIDAFPKTKNAPERVEAEPLSNRSEGLELSKKDRMRTKVRATPYQKLTEGSVVNIADSVHQIGKRQMRTLAVLQRVQKDFQKGSYKAGDLKADLKELDMMIAEVEQELSRLQSEVAAKGTSKLVGKVEEAISNSIGLIGELKAKKAELQPVAETQFEQAAKSLQTIQDNVQASIQEPKRAGVLMFNAYQELEKFDSYLLPVHGVSEEVTDQIEEMQTIAKALLQSAESEKTVDLSSHKQDLSVDLIYTDNPAKAKKILSKPETEKRLEEILSKKITSALWAKPAERAGLLVEIDEILDFIALHDPSMSHRIQNSENLKPLIARYRRETSDPNRQRAVRLRKDARVIINEISSSDKDRAQVLYKAIPKRDEIKALYENETDIEKRGALKIILDEVDSLIDKTGKKQLELTKNKAQLRSKILNPDKQIKGEAYQIKRVLANDMMRLLIGIDEVLSEDARGKMQELFKSKKVDVSESYVLDLIEQLENRRPQLYQEIFAEPPMNDLLNRCKMKFTDVEIDRCKMNFSEWTKVGVKLNNHFNTLVAQADELRSLGPAKNFISANNLPGSSRIDNVNKLRADIAARKKQLSAPNDDKELEQLSKLDRFAERFLETHDELVNTQAVLETLIRDISDGIKKLGAISDPILQTKINELQAMLREMNDFVTGRKPASDAFMYAQSLMPMINQIGAVNTIYVDTFEVQTIRNAPESFQIQRLTDEIKRLQSIDTPNKQGYAQLAKLINDYKRAYDSVGTQFKGLYDGPPGGPYTIKPGQNLTEEQVRFLDYLDQTHTYLTAELDKINVQDTKFGQLFDTHIENFKLVVKNKIKDVAAIREQVQGKGQYQSLPGQAVAKQGQADYVGLRIPGQPEYTGFSKRDLYRQAIGGKHVQSAPNQEQVRALLADIDQFAADDAAHQKQWADLRYCLASFNDTYVQVGDMFSEFYTPRGELVPNPQFHENHKEWIKWMDEWQTHLEQAMSAIDVDRSDQSSPLAANFQLVNGIIQDKKDAVDALSQLARRAA